MRRRHNLFVWAGFAVALLAVLSYIPVFALFPVTRDIPWVNLLLFVAAAWLLAVGLKRAFGEPQLYRGKISGSILGILTLALLAFFCYGVFVASKQIPPPGAALHAGQHAPDFSLPSADGKQVVLSDLLRKNRGVVLIFYRGYW